MTCLSFIDFCGISDHVDLQLLSTHDTKLQTWDTTRFTVMESGLVVMWEKTSEQPPAAFHLYQKGLKRLREVKGLCEHNMYVYLLPMTMNNKHLLAVRCAGCEVIRLLDLETEEVTVAFHDQRYYTGRMCHGEGNIMYAAHAVRGAIQVLELNTGHVPFTGPTRTIQSGMKQYYSLHYIPSPNRLTVISGKSARIIRAVSAETGEKVWEVRRGDRW